MANLLLFLRLIVRPLGREPLRTALTLLVVALGVSVVVAIELAGTAAAGSFRSSIEALAGKSDLELSAVGGMDERLLGRLASLPYDFRFDPRLEDYALIEQSGEVVPLVGVDLVSRALLEASAWKETPNLLQKGNPIWVGERLRGLAGKRIRITLNDRSDEYLVRGVLPATSTALTDSNLIVMDIGLAQQALGRLGRVDRVEVHLPRGRNQSEWESILRTVLPAEVSIQPQGARTDENRKMLAAFRWNLRVLSYISLVVGAFLIYNTISISVVRRRAEIGIVRALGATQRLILAAFLAEAAFFGTVGGLLGVPLGRVMAEGAVKLLGATVEALYVSSEPAPIQFTAGTVLIALALGISMSLLSAFAPALEAAAVAPVESMARGREEYLVRVGTGRTLVAGLILVAAGGGLACLPPVFGMPLFGYLSAIVLIAGSALTVPALVTGLSQVLQPILRRLAVEPFLAARSLLAALRRTSVLVAALATAIAMMTSVGIMVGSFRETVTLWMDNQLKADFFLRPAGPAASDRHPTIDNGLATEIERLPGVAAVDRFRVYQISYRGMPVSLGGGETTVAKVFNRTEFLPGSLSRAEIMRELPRGDNVIVSEPFANKHHARTGDVIKLPLAGGEHPFRILGVYYDYSSERGYIIMHRQVMLRYLPDPNPTNIAVYIRDGYTQEQVRQSLDQVCARRSVLIFSNGSLRREAIRIFDRTFAITYALEAIAVFVAVMGIAGALLALVIDRRRELGLLRFLGAAAPQIRRLILCEAALIGLLAQVSGMLLGATLSLVLIFVINKQSFGWTIQFHWPVAVLLGALGIVYIATVLAGLYPARIALRLNPIEVVHEE